MTDEPQCIWRDLLAIKYWYQSDLSIPYRAALLIIYDLTNTLTPLQGGSLANMRITGSQGMHRSIYINCGEAYLLSK